jgi:hypothetical protein
MGETAKRALDGLPATTICARELVCACRGVGLCESLIPWVLC